MNGILMLNGIDAISAPTTKAELFNKTMVDFYATRNATPMMKFMMGCGLNLPDKPAAKEAKSPVASHNQAGISKP